MPGLQTFSSFQDLFAQLADLTEEKAARIAAVMEDHQRAQEALLSASSSQKELTEFQRGQCTNSQISSRAPQNTKDFMSN